MAFITSSGMMSWSLLSWAYFSADRRLQGGLARPPLGARASGTRRGGGRPAGDRLPLLQGATLVSGEDSGERLDVIPAYLGRRVTITRNCDSTAKTAYTHFLLTVAAHV